MGFFARALKVLIVLLTLFVVVLWFAAHRGDRGYIEKEVTIDRPAPLVFRWIITDEFLRRWISDLVKLERTGPPNRPGHPSNTYRIDEFIAKRRVAFDITIIRAIPNQAIDLTVKPATDSPGNFSATANFKLFPSGDYTRVVFTSQSNFRGLRDQMFEPILTYAMRKKMEEDLTRLKLMIEAGPASQ